MTQIFADTSFYMTLIGGNRSERELYLSMMRGPDRKIITTDYILVELGAFFREGSRRNLFHKLWELIHSDPHTKVVPASRELLLRGFDLFVLHRDKDWSLTDCVSFVVMHAEKVSMAFSFDHHFEQAGFILVK